MSYSKQMLNTSLLFTSHCWGVAVCLATICMGVVHFLWLMYSWLYIASDTNMHRFFCDLFYGFCLTELYITYTFQDDALRSFSASEFGSKDMGNKWAMDTVCTCLTLESKVHGAIMGPTWGRQDPVGSHVGRVNLGEFVLSKCVYPCYRPGCDSSLLCDIQKTY